jgi:hypothetical protein
MAITAVPNPEPLTVKVEGSTSDERCWLSSIIKRMRFAVLTLFE